MSVPYKLHKGDCLAFMREMKDKSIHAVITDPPYGIGVQNKNCVAGRNDRRSDEKITWDEFIPSQEYFDEIFRISKYQIIFGAIYYNCFNGGAIVWDKLQPLPDSSQCEIASISKYNKVFKFTQRWTNFVNTKQTDHPTEKPTDLMKYCIELVAKEGETIFDPFMGSGSAGVAAIETGRRFIGCEISDEYFAVAEKRIKSAVFQPALLHVAQQSVQRTGGESGQQNLFSAGEVLPAKVTRQSTRR